MNTAEVVSLTDDPRRLIALEAVHNFRDLGGYPTSTGQSTKWRTLFRADGLYRLTTNDAQIVIDLGVKTVIDLRTEKTKKRNCITLPDCAVTYWGHANLFSVSFQFSLPVQRLRKDLSVTAKVQG